MPPFCADFAHFASVQIDEENEGIVVCRKQKRCGDMYGGHEIHPHKGCKFLKKFHDTT
jgi:hypothetical protein